MGTVVALHLKPPAGGVQPVDELTAIAGVGFEGDKCQGREKRQVLLVARDEAAYLDVEPGALREQLFVDMPGLQALEPGTRVQAGEAVFTITQNCTPCARQAEMLGREANEFRSVAQGHRGMLAVVEQGGKVRIGDEVCVLP